MALQTLARIVARLRESGLLAPEGLRALDELHGQHHEPEPFLRALLKASWITAFQTRELFSGRGRDLLLGEFVLLDRLGEGATSRVLKARHCPTDQVVALKVLRTDLPGLWEAADRLHHEGRAGARLIHPNILRTHDVVREGTTVSLVLEYVEGSDLARRVRQQGPQPAEEACDWVRQAALGLQHAFECGLVHRDIKPSNLMLTADDNVVKVLDLGLACPVDVSAGGAFPGAGGGTPDYLAPERMEDPANVDIRSDVYSLGCTLYHLLTGQPPFPGGTVEDKLLRHRQEEPTPVEELCPNLPEGLGEILRGMMAKYPPDRYPTPRDVREALLPFAQATQNAGFVLELEDGLETLDPGQTTAVLPIAPSAGATES